MEIRRRVALPCDIERAWTFLTTWERQASWMRDADRVTVVSPHREGVGVRLEVRTRLFQIPAFTEPMEVTVWEPPRRLAIRHGGPIGGVGEWRFDPAADGTTFTWIERVHLRVPVVGDLAARAYRPIVGRLMDRALHDLRDAIAGGT
jgi:uncharacterized protein YndB with AHSA1/START domain